MRVLIAALFMMLAWSGGHGALAAQPDANEVVYAGCGDEGALPTCYAACKKVQKRLDELSNAARGQCREALNSKEAPALKTKACDSSGCIVRLKLASRRRTPKTDPGQYEQGYRDEYRGQGYQVTIVGEPPVMLPGLIFHVSIKAPGGKITKLEHDCSGNGCNAWEHKSGPLKGAELTMLGFGDGKDVMLKTPR
ncbi:hypothetical protein [Methylopila sp. M107]|uniref:hypothetical protein n=1 Tax=Methylopila sp. M107 TaxID=1101190 RepID=UPI00036A4BB9|nr:hypothetical protein [Methylopila sp. M107]